MPDSAKDFAEKLLGQTQILEIFKTAFQKTIIEFAHVKAEAGEALMASAFGEQEAFVVGFIRFQGAPSSYEIVLPLPQDVATEFCQGTFPGEQPSSDLAKDVTSEILNISFGTIDPLMKMQGLRLVSSFPVGLSSSAANAFAKKLNQECVQIPFQTFGKKVFRLRIFSPGSISHKWQYTPIKR